MGAYAKNKKYCIEEKAKRRYGLTKIFENAGYILEDGSLLDFSRENNMHQASSHGDIKELFKNLNAYDICVNTNGTVEEDQRKYAKNILVTLDCIDNDHNVCVSIPVRNLKTLN